MPRFLAGLVVLLVSAAALGALLLDTPERAEACAFDPRRPDAYERDATRDTYLRAMDAAAVNALFPGDGHFALPRIDEGDRDSRRAGDRAVPTELLRSIGWVESNLTMASRSVAFDSVGEALVSFDCGHGVMQITTGMTVPLGANNQATHEQVSTATHYVYNIARGAYFLADKWNQAPEYRPLVGTDTDSDPGLIENWYYATWGYNGFTGPGSSSSNHPMDPNRQWPRAEYRCDGSQSRGTYPYQELVWGCMANPPERGGRALWSSTDASLPNQTDPEVFRAMSPERFVFPYERMDIPTPQPSHRAQRPSVSGVREQLLGSPQLAVDDRSVRISVDGGPGEQQATVRIRNTGSGILSWHATTSDNFLVLSPPAGVAIGSGAACNSGRCPGGELVITINPTLLPDAEASGRVRISSPNSSSPPIEISVNASAEFEVGVPGTSRAR